MDATLVELSKNPLAVSIISLVVGSVATLLLTSLRRKSGVLGYRTTWNQIGISADDNIFGEVRVRWQNHQLRNLYFYTIEVENLSSSDYDNLDFRVYSGTETIILNEQTRVIDTPEIVRWSPEFRARIHVPDGETVTERQSDEYNHSRHYLLPVLNRRQKLSFAYLCTNPDDDGDPGIFISTQAKGVRLKLLKQPFVILNPIWGVPIPVALARALVLAVAVVVACGILVESVWLAAFLSMAFGLTGQIFGAALYRVERFARDALTR